jgi:hypothetical protein
VVAICTLFVSLIIIARSVGFNQPEPIKITALHLDECSSPCWVGILPSKTSLAEAYNYVNRSYRDGDIYQLTQTYSGVHIVDKTNGQEFDVVFDYWKGEKPEDRRFHEIKFTAFKNPISLAELNPILGSPEKIRLASSFPDDKYSSIFFTAYHIEIIVKKNPCDEVPINAPILAMKLISEQEYDDMFHTISWHGFSSCYEGNHNIGSAY